MTDEFAFFKDLFEGELDVNHKEHPNNGMLLSLAYGTLESEIETAMISHVATCAQCSAQFLELQGSQQVVSDLLTEQMPNPLHLGHLQKANQTSEKIKPTNTKESFWVSLWNSIWFNPPVRRHGLAFASVGGLLLFFNWISNIIIESQPQLTNNSEDLGWWSIWIVLAWIPILGVHIFRVFKESLNMTCNK